MALAPGSKLGPYEIQSPLGAGGMGEVYRARDTRLDRTVAIKILPAHLSDNAEAKQRFEREARAISSLNHPNICTLHDVGSQDGTSYLVMEYVQGETLASRLQKEPLPLKQALECGMQICDALEKAHRAGIVHRDLKPGNIMLTASGAKLLDFGLAKPAAAMLGSQALSDKGQLTSSSPTMNLSMLSAAPQALTQQGSIVGTFQYIAPEVAQGREADARSDIFSFGCVLYEMIAGRRAFEGKSQLSVLTAILEKDPEPLTAVQPATPPALDYAVQACLEKNPDNRFQTAHDLKLHLAWIAKTGSQAGVPALKSTKRNKSTLWLAALAALAVAATALAAGWWQARSPRQVIRATLLPPQGTQFALLSRNGPAALSPDGKNVAFIASREGKTSLWVRSLDKTLAAELPGTVGAFFPFWSPDGYSVGFFTNGKLWRTNITAGLPIVICDAVNGRGASWGAEDVILFAPNIGTSIYRVSAKGGTPTAVTDSVTGTVSHRWPVFLPDGKHFLYMRSHTGTANDRNEIQFASLDERKETTLLRGRYYLSGFASGWLLAVRNGDLTAQRLDSSSGKLSGDIATVAEHVQCDDLVAGAIFSAAQNGVLLYLEGGVAGERIVWSDAHGKEVSQVLEAGFFGAFRLSPDETRIAYPFGFASDLWIADLKRGTNARLSFGGTFVSSPAWSPDGRTLYFSFTDGSGPVQIYARSTDASSPQRRVLTSQQKLFVADVSPDGKYLLYEEGDANSSTLKALPVDGKGDPLVLLENLEGFSGALGGGFNARLSPTGDWLAYQSRESGRPEVYLINFPSGRVKHQVSLSGGAMPVWSKDGKRLYYLDPTQKLVSVDIQLGKDSVQIGRAETLFQTAVRAGIIGGGYSAASDGRFLLDNATTEISSPLTLVMNWNAELK